MGLSLPRIAGVVSIRTTAPSVLADVKCLLLYLEPVQGGSNETKKCRNSPTYSSFFDYFCGITFASLSWKLLGKLNRDTTRLNYRAFPCFLQRRSQNTREQQIVWVKIGLCG